MKQTNKYTSKEDKLIIAKRDRAHDYFMGNEFTDASTYVMYMLVVNKTREQAEKILRTQLA